MGSKKKVISYVNGNEEIYSKSPTFLTLASSLSKTTTNWTILLCTLKETTNHIHLSYHIFGTKFNKN